MPGIFVTFEGGEGAGKSTQVERLARTLRAGAPSEVVVTREVSATREVIVTREPGGSPRAERIRSAILSGAAKPYGPFAEALMFGAARLDHLDTLVRPALARGAIVLCDRFMDSTRAYQGAAGGLAPEVVAALERVVVAEARPDLTLILDLPAEGGLARAAARGRATGQGADRFEAEALTFHTRLREAFRAIAAAEPARCRLIDATLEPDHVEAAIRATVAARFPDLLPNPPARRPRTDAA